MGTMMWSLVLVVVEASLRICHYFMDVRFASFFKRRMLALQNLRELTSLAGRYQRPLQGVHLVLWYAVSMPQTIKTMTGGRRTGEQSPNGSNL